MTDSIFDDKEAQNAEKEVQKQLDKIGSGLSKKVKIAVVGQVSAGKSSLINALFNVPKGKNKVEVGAISGVTTKTKEISWGKNVVVIDSPGLNDVKKENSQETQSMLSDIDVGIFVVNGSVDESQKANYDELKYYAGKVFIVLNKVDEYDKKPAALDKVIEQWKQTLELSDSEQIFRTCTDGYDPDYAPDAEMNIRGVDELRDSVLSYLEKEGKNLILEKEMKSKSELARKIIYTALVSVAGAAFIPGSSIYITGAQAVAIMSIHYVYTDEVLSKKGAIAAIPLFISQSIGSNLFLWVKSVLPPTGVLDVAAAGVAVTVTLAMLSTVNWIYENGYNIDNIENKAVFQEQYGNFYNVLKKMLDGVEWAIALKDPSMLKFVFRDIIAQVIK